MPEVKSLSTDPDNTDFVMDDAWWRKVHRELAEERRLQRCLSTQVLLEFEAARKWVAR